MLKIEMPQQAMSSRVKKKIEEKNTGRGLQELTFTTSVNVKLNCFHKEQRYGQTRKSLT